MVQIPPAARQFIAEVRQVDEDVTARAAGEPDGFGVHRTVSFTGASEWLGDVLRSMRNDDRVHGWSWQKNGDSIEVTFAHTSVSDYDHEFGVTKAAGILRDASTAGAVPDEAAPPKKAAKKTAKKTAKKSGK